MRTLGLWMLLLAALPVRAEVKSERIALQYLPASEFERLLVPGASSNVALPQLPAGLFAWSVDMRQNVLTVAGSSEAIESLKQAVRLLDVPPLPVRVSLRGLRAEDPAVRALLVDLLPVPRLASKLPVRMELLSAGQAALLENCPTVEQITLDTENNRPVHLRRSEPQRPQPLLTTLTPRVNADDSVTLKVTLPLPYKYPASGSSFPSGGTMAEVRMVPGSPALLVPDSSGIVWLVRVSPAPPSP